MKPIKSLGDPAFSRYGAVVEGLDFSDIIEAALKIAMPVKGVSYERSIRSFEATQAYASLKSVYAGEQDIEAGLCWGYNDLLNAVEYHRSSEVDIAVSDLIVMLGDRRDIKDNTYDSSLLESFLVPAGTAVEFYATTLHYAPCHCDADGFRSVVVLPRETNAPLSAEGKARALQASGEQRLLFARDKWLIAHPETAEAKEDKAFAGIIGENIRYYKE